MVGIKVLLLLKGAKPACVAFVLSRGVLTEIGHGGMVYSGWNSRTLAGNAEQESLNVGIVWCCRDTLVKQTYRKHPELCRSAVDQRLDAEFDAIFDEAKVKVGVGADVGFEERQKLYDGEMIPATEVAYLLGRTGCSLWGGWATALLADSMEECCSTLSRYKLGNAQSVLPVLH